MRPNYETIARLPDSEFLRYGYAPGKYLVECVLCHNLYDNMDKRAIRCRDCAVGLHGLTGGSR